MAAVSIAEVMEAYAKDAESDARKRGIALDYSEASLEQVDKILGIISLNGVLEPKSPAEKEALWDLSKKYGGYIGQVVIKHFGGQWELENLPDGTSRILMRCRGIQAFPAQKVYKRLTQDRFSGVSGYLRALREIAERSKRDADEGRS